MGEFDAIAMMVCNDIIKKLEDGEMTLKDQLIRDFVPCIFEEGNFKFLMALARSECNDEDYNAVMAFLLKVNQARIDGEKHLRSI